MIRRPGTAAACATETVYVEALQTTVASQVAMVVPDARTPVGPVRTRTVPTGNAVVGIPEVSVSLLKVVEGPAEKSPSNVTAELVETAVNVVPAITPAALFTG